MSNILCQYMVFRNSMLSIWMRSQYMITFLYLSGTSFGTFGTMIGSTCWTLWRNVFPENVSHCIHRYPQTSQNILIGLGYSIWCCYQPHVIVTILVVHSCAGIFLYDHPYSYHEQGIVSSFPSLVGWNSVNFSLWCAHFFLLLRSCLISS